MAQAPRDQNFVPAVLFESSTVSGTTITGKIDQATGRILTTAAGGSGTVTSVSVVSTNGFAGSVADATTTPAITLSTTVTGILSGNGTAISAASTTGSGAVVLANSPTFVDDITVGTAATATGSILFKGLTSGTVTMKVADVAGTWTMTLPTTDGGAGEFLQTDGAGVTSWAAVSASAGGNNTEVQYNNGGSLGGITNATSNGTTLTITSGRATTDFSPSSNDGAALGTTALGFADLHLATGGTINWANGEILITETDANTLTISGGTLAAAGAITGASSLTLGAAAGTTGSVVFTGTTSGAVTVKSADAAGTWTLTLPDNDGDSGQVLSTNGSGVTSWVSAGGVPTTITVADEAADTSCYLAFFTAATGDLGPKTNANLTFDSSTGIATFGQTITGSITGNAGTVTVADAGGDTTTFVLLATDTTGSLSPRTDAGLSYNATTNVLTSTGGFAGDITGNAATVTVADEATDTSCFINFTTAATGSLGIKTNTNLTFNSNTGVLTSASAVLTTADINGGTIDNTTIGATTAAAITGTTITANTGFMPDANDGAYLGQSGTAFSDLFLASGALIDFAAGNSVITHSSAVLTVSTGDLRVTTAGTNTASVVTVGGTQTLTSKTLTSPTINTANIGGITQLAEGASIALDAAGSADGAYSGITIAGTAGATLAFGDLVYLASADSRWELADADAASTSDRMMGMVVLAAAADGDPTRLLLMGTIRADAAFPALTIGSAVYVGETAGDIQVAIPTGADNVIRRVGYALTADEIYFNPSMDSQITVA